LLVTITGTGLRCGGADTAQAGLVFFSDAAGFNYMRFTLDASGLGIHKLERIVDGELDELVSALRTHRQAELLRQGDGRGEGG
jgi:hypothetical protein